MKLTTKGRYGLAAMVYLARHGTDGPISLRQMAETGIQLDYLEQLLAALRRGGLVNAVRGAQGGYQLSRSPAEITVGEIRGATEGPVRFCDCATDAAACSQRDHCDTQHMWHYLSDQMNGLLDSITLEKVIADGQQDQRGGNTP